MYHRLFAIAIFASLSLAAHADDAKPKLPTLAQALAQAAAPKSELYLSVDADQVMLPKDAPPPAPGDTVAQIATEYGRLVSGFGDVSVVAPHTITVVNVPPDTPNPYDGMDPKQLLKLLTAGFKAGQWKAFLSENGIGYADLLTDDQRSLFEALFPGGVLKARRPADDTSKEVSGDDLRLAHLRLAYVGSMALAVTGKPNEHVFTGANAPHLGPATYEMENSQAYNADHEYGADVRTIRANELKPSDLDNDDGAWRVDVPMAGVKTVDDLIRVIAAATQREVYADPRYAAKPVTLLGADRPARALDLLKALALCVGGTYRRVGPALVLTDDRMGLAVKHKLWLEFEDKALAAAPRGSTGEPPKPSDELKYTALDIPFTGDDVPATKKQMADYWSAWRKNPQPWQNGRMDLTLPYNELSPAQQRAAREIKALNDKWGDKTTLDADILVQTAAEVEIVVPALDAPVIIPGSYDRLLPDPPLSDKEKTAAAQREEAGAPQIRIEQAQTPQSLKPMLAAFTRRAARLEPKSSEDLTSRIAQMRALGVNELWLKITPEESDKNDDAAIALLRQAADEGKAAHIAVYPTFSIFAWRPPVAPARIDLTLMGEPAPDQDAAAPSHNLDAVSPFDPAAGRRLISLIGKAASVPGIAGMVWDNMVPAGYERLGEHESMMMGDNPLGYSVDGRLAYLRKAHADPVDANDNYYAHTRANVTVPGFDEQILDSKLLLGWGKLRMGVRDDLLRWLTTALPATFAPGPSQLPLIVPPANNAQAGIYGSWDDFARPSPAVEYIFPKDAQGKEIEGSSGTERMASTLAYRRLIIFPRQAAPAAENAVRIARDLQAIAKTEEKNIVLDGVSDETVLDTLTRAEASVKSDSDVKAAP
ncbi:hypothetical protein CCAX7_56580 [Capsulimonas corticalis]|uniref:Uncharacterized protein n=1 Tax=Capsulimonas corticalis TaxID=2219043 RepID=A0A402D0G1_9BACT|nr:hypothetical protein [Capsulimonas corticalis]BDI33607.1 hypothetical protein CCAX7_56580 [Capsulimonas corticalis]